MAKNYILAEYRNETRKIEGDWSKKKFNELVSAVKSRFGIEQQVDFKIFDKGANTYFIIDRSEMRELRKGALVKVVNAKGGRKATKAATRKSGDARNDSRGNNRDNRDNGRKGRKGGNLPPGVPAYSKADDARRNNWNVGSQVELFSDRASKWVKGKIIDVFHDHEGEWLLVEYQGFRQKEIQRFSNYVRSASRDNGRADRERGDSRDNGRAERKKKEDPMKRKRREKGDEPTRGDGGRKDRDGGRGGREKREEKREKREKKVTTQSKFRKRRVEDEAERETPENEIQLKGNSNNLKQYIDRAAILLRGPLPKTEEDLAEEAEAKAAAEEAAKVAAEEEAKAAEEAKVEAGDDDAKVESEAAKETKAVKKERKPRGPAPPSKKFDVVYLVGIGRAMGHVVSCVELIKRIVPGLHQTTELETVEFKDVYEPTEEGLENVEVSRFVTRLKVTLAVSGKDLDSASLGYQSPIAPDEFAANIEYKYPDEQRQKRRAKGRGRRRQREEKKAAVAGGQ